MLGIPLILLVDRYLYNHRIWQDQLQEYKHLSLSDLPSEVQYSALVYIDVYLREER